LGFGNSPCDNTHGAKKIGTTQARSGPNSAGISIISTDLANRGKFAGMIYAGGISVQGFAKLKTHRCSFDQRGIHPTTKLTEYYRDLLLSFPKPG
jgi:hypothetical protein